MSFDLEQAYPLLGTVPNPPIPVKQKCAVVVAERWVLYEYEHLKSKGGVILHWNISQLSTFAVAQLDHGIDLMFTLSGTFCARCV